MKTTGHYESDRLHELIQWQILDLGEIGYCAEDIAYEIRLPIESVKAILKRGFASVRPLAKKDPPTVLCRQNHRIYTRYCFQCFMECRQQGCGFSESGLRAWCAHKYLRYRQRFDTPR